MGVDDHGREVRRAAGARAVAFYGHAPPWPPSMIGPNGAELIRWSELWSHPRAGVWADTGQEHAVAALVRAEYRCSQTVPSDLARFELDRLRVQLRLNDS